jgi:hypothetical protein
VAGRIRSNEKFNDLIGNRTRDLPAFSIVPPLTTRNIEIFCTPTTNLLVLYGCESWFLTVRIYIKGNFKLLHPLVYLN